VWHSDDGKIWTEATSRAAWAARTGQSGAVYDGRLWIFGGALRDGVWTNDVWSSTDGVRWERAPEPPWSQRSGTSAVVFDGKLWIFGGRARGGALDDVWYLERNAR
jgi:hypothetical protein